MDPFHWTCPYCDRNATITESNYHQGSTTCSIDNSIGSRRLYSIFIVCPNPQCKKFTLRVALYNYCWNGSGWDTGEFLQSWSLIPPSAAIAFPDYIPNAITEDYDEACVISELSPKASATLSRRCLQGIIRDFWKVKPGRLVDEIEQIRDKVDPLTWEAIDSVRKVGNIGAHMEKDINVMVEVDHQEANLLIGLIETLIRDWYIARHEREKRLSQIKGLAVDKDTQRKGNGS